MIYFKCAFRKVSKIHKKKLPKIVFEFNIRFGMKKILLFFSYKMQRFRVKAIFRLIISEKKFFLDFLKCVQLLKNNLWKIVNNYLQFKIFGHSTLDGWEELKLEKKTDFSKCHSFGSPFTIDDIFKTNDPTFIFKEETELFEK